MNKKIILWILVLISSFSMVFAFDEAYIVPEEISAKQGAEFAFDVNINISQQVYALNINLTYNPDILEFVSASEGNFLNKDGLSTFFIVIPKEGIVSIGITRYNTQTCITGEGTIANLIFNSKSGGTSDLNLGIQLLDNTVTPILDVSAISGKAVIEAVSVPVVDKSSGGRSSSGSGGFAYDSFSYGTKIIDMGYSDIFFFLIKDEKHNFVIKKIYEDSVDFRISSVMINDNLSIGEIKEYDVDKDGIKDLAIEIISLRKNDGSFQFTLLEKEEEPKEVVDESVKEELKEVVDEPVKEEEPKRNKKVIGIIIVSIVVIGLICQGIVSSIKKKKKKEDD